MAITLWGTKTVAFAGGTSDHTIDLTSGWTGGLGPFLGFQPSPAVGQLVVVSICVGGSSGGSGGGDVACGVITADYVEEAELFSSDNSTTNLSISRKIMGLIPDTSVVVNDSTDTAYAIVVSIQLWDGTDITTPMDVAVATATGTNGGRPDPPAITPVTSGAVIGVIGASGFSTTAVFTQTGTELDNFESAVSVDTSDAVIGFGSYASWTSGSFNPVAWLGNTTNTGASWAAATYALRPRAGSYSLTCAQGSAALSGQAVVLRAARKIAAAQGSYSLSGQAAGLRRGYTVASVAGSYALSGQAVGTLSTRRITAAQGSYALSGQVAILRDARVLTAAAGSYSLTGVATLLRRGFSLPAAAGNYSLAGQASAFRVARVTINAVGSYTLSGQAGILRGARRFPAAHGTFTLSGQAAILRRAYPLVAATGSIALSGQAVAGRAARRMSIDQGSYAVAGQAVSFLSSGKLLADAGLFSLSGQAATLRQTRRMQGLSGSFTLMGQGASMSRGYNLAAFTGTYSLAGGDISTHLAGVQDTDHGLMTLNLGLW